MVKKQNTVIDALIKQFQISHVRRDKLKPDTDYEISKIQVQQQNQIDEKTLKALGRGEHWLNEINKSSMEMSK